MISKIFIHKRSMLPYWRHWKIVWQARYKPRVSLCFTFLQWSWEALRGKLGVIDGRIVTSNGGFKYYQLEISKLPLSEKNTYE